MKNLTIAAIAIAGLALLAACASLGGAEALLGGAREDAAALPDLADFEAALWDAFDTFGARIEELAIEAAEAAAEREAEIARLQGAVAGLEERVEHQRTITAEIYVEAEAAKEIIRRALEYLSGGAAVDAAPAAEAA